MEGKVYYIVTAEAMQRIEQNVEHIKKVVPIDFLPDGFSELEQRVVQMRLAAVERLAMADAADDAVRNAAIGLSNE